MWYRSISQCHGILGRSYNSSPIIWQIVYDGSNCYAKDLSYLRKPNFLKLASPRDVTSRGNKKAWKKISHPNSLAVYGLTRGQPVHHHQVRTIDGTRRISAAAGHSKGKRRTKGACRQARHTRHGGHSLVSWLCAHIACTRLTFATCWLPVGRPHQVEPANGCYCSLLSYMFFIFNFV